MNKVISVRPMAFGNHSIELDNGHKVSIARGEALPKVGDEYETKTTETLSVSHSPTKQLTVEELEPKSVDVQLAEVDNSEII